MNMVIGAGCSKSKENFGAGIAGKQPPPENWLEN